MSRRDEMRRMARESIGRGDATGWFEAFYQEAAGSWDRIPWADLVPNPYLLEWLATPEGRASRGPCLVVGCGLGDDAEAFSATGREVVAFDVSATAIEACRARFPGSRTSYVVADVLSPPPSWTGRFDLVFESYTLQVLPGPVRAEALGILAGLVAPLGRLLVLCRGRDPEQPEGELPWPLSRRELDVLGARGLVEERFESFLDHEEPPVRRFRALYRRPELL